MGTSPRRQKIEAMLHQEPGDQFLRYALAAELDNEGEAEPALDLYRGLAHDSPPHVPAYFRAAQLLVKLDRIAEARTFLRVGFEQASNQNDSHAAGEMSELLAALGSLGE
jgi:thioredoxin-like negative regulator of GroEL